MSQDGHPQLTFIGVRSGKVSNGQDKYEVWKGLFLIMFVFVAQSFPGVLVLYNHRLLVLAFILLAELRACSIHGGRRPWIVI
jgi:hypothetical protein